LAIKVDRAAEVAVQHIPEPDQELLRQRLIEAHLAAFCLHFRNRCGRRQRHRRRVDRKQAQHAEQ